MFSELGETPDHPVEPSGQGERERERHTERGKYVTPVLLKDKFPHLLLSRCSTEDESFVKSTTKMLLSHTWCSFAPPQLLVWCLAGSQSQIIFWWWVECRITCSYKTTTEAAYCTHTRRKSHWSRDLFQKSAGFSLSQNRKEFKTMIGFGGQTQLKGGHLYHALQHPPKREFFLLKSAADGTEGLMWEVG